MGLVEVVDGAIAFFEGLEVDTDDTYKIGKAEQGVREKSGGELKISALFMFQSVDSKLVSPYHEGCGEPAAVPGVAICHANDHTLPKAESKKKNQGVKANSRLGNRGDHKVGLKPEDFEDKANVCRCEVNPFVLKFECCTESHLVGASVVN
jgi:hypothetical protein